MDTTRVKPKLHRRRRRIYESFWSRRRTQNIYTKDLLEIGKSCEELSWNLRTATSHKRRNKQSCRTSCSSSKKRDISRIYCNLDEMESGGQIPDLLLLSAEWPRPPYRREISIWTKIWRNIQRTIYIIWRIDWKSPKNSEKTKHDFIYSKQNNYEDFFGYAFIAGWNLGKRYFWLLMLKIWKIWRHQNYFRRLNAKEVLITQRNEELVFPAADDSAKLSGRNY